MPKVNFATIDDDTGDFTPLPAGTYPCRLAEVQIGRTGHGDEMWMLRWVVEAGPYKGRCIFDNLPFSSAALKRVKLVCERLAIDTSGEIDLRPSMLHGRRCLVTVEIDDYTTADGLLRPRNVVPWAGYQRLDEGESHDGVAGCKPSTNGPGDEIPF